MKAVVNAVNYYLPYNIYVDTGMTVPFPASITTVSGATSKFNASGNVDDIVLHARTVALGDLPRAGNYTDSVLFTVMW